MSDAARQDRLVTVKSAMQQLSIGTTTAYKYISMGVLEAVKLSPPNRFAPDRSAPNRFAPDRSAPNRSALPRFAR